MGTLSYWRRSRCYYWKSVWPVLMSLLLIPDCGQTAEKDGAVVFESKGER